MPGSLILDVLLVLVLLAYLVYGFRLGFIRSIAGIGGLVAGAVAAILAIPLVSSWVPQPQWRVAAVLATVLVLIAAGNTLGLWIGRLIGRPIDRTPLRVVDRIVGAVAAVVLTGLLLSLVAGGVSSLGIPVVTQAISSSAVLRTIDNLTPDPVDSLLAQIRSAVVDDGIPTITGALGAGQTLEIPDVDTTSDELSVAARSVVRITGNAYACGQGQAGSGVVIAPERVLTNAHVVAGVDQPIVETPGDTARPGEIVYFDPVDDLAVIAVDGLAASPLPFTPNLAVGEAAVVDGYPFGGPFSSQPAVVNAVDSISVPDIYGQNPSPRQVYVLSAVVEHGNSGGPLLTEDGSVVGLVFAKDTAAAKIGYALAMDELTPVIAQAPALNAAVPTGDCIKL
ncbi:MarP family serine protease [Compostimonas suwonensis]|uniref:Colicin V production protein n=1 Tax=Compostimonas suwonensis TaxID=1048394 RepID=A0A2M9BCN6_9MICO|nr:MarP family serine protease [Compostimonas suwonensis]PJJ55719.1 colicin V production protein [Compostimonas suwonensis]